MALNCVQPHLKSDYFPHVHVFSLFRPIQKPTKTANIEMQIKVEGLQISLLKLVQSLNQKNRFLYLKTKSSSQSGWYQHAYVIPFVMYLIEGQTKKTPYRMGVDVVKQLLAYF